MTSPTSPPPEPARAAPPGPPMFNVPPVTLGYGAVLLAVYAALRIAGSGLRETAVLWLSLIPLRIAAAAESPIGPGDLLAAATLVTHAVLHLDLLHLLINAGFLLAFGSAVERAMGSGRALGLLLASALGGAAAQLALSWGEAMVMFGASGVVSGCMGGVTRLMLTGDAPAQRRRTALNLIGAFVVINLLIAAVGGGLMGIDAEIAWAAHLGGFAAGFLIGHRPGASLRV